MLLKGQRCIDFDAYVFLTIHFAKYVSPPPPPGMSRTGICRSKDPPFLTWPVPKTPLFSSVPKTPLFYLTRAQDPSFFSLSE